MKNSLYLSDNLPTLRELPTASVDLVYLDPPFASKAAYSVSARALRYKALGELGWCFTTPGAMARKPKRTWSR